MGSGDWNKRNRRCGVSNADAGNCAPEAGNGISAIGAGGGAPEADNGISASELEAPEAGNAARGGDCVKTVKVGHSA